MKTPTIKVLLSFAGNTPDNTRITFARNVLAQLYTQAHFTDIPVTAAQLEAAITAFSDAKVAQPNSGKAGTAEKNKKRQELDALLKILALYVQVASDNDLALLLSTGFDAASTNRAPYPLSKPMIRRIDQGMAGEALLTLSTEACVRGCEVRVAEIGPDGTPGEFRPVVFSMSSIRITIQGLTPGVLYAYQGRNVGGSTTYSDWSDLLVKRAG